MDEVLLADAIPDGGSATEVLLEHAAAACGVALRVPDGARAALKARQRQPVAATFGPESVEDMAISIMVGDRSVALPLGSVL